MMEGPVEIILKLYHIVPVKTIDVIKIDIKLEFKTAFVKNN